VGIGTASPTSFGSYKYLTIQGGNTSNGGALELRNSDNTLNGQIYVGSSTMVVQATSAVPLLFNTTGTERMRIDSSGNVGIGTTSPNSLLTVQSGNILLRSAVTTGALSSYNLGFSATATGGAAAYVTSYRENANEASSLVFGNWNGSSSGERMRIDSSGNLLVGTTSTVGTSAAGVIHAVSASTVFPPLALRNANASSGNYWKVGPDGGGNTLVVQNQSSQGVYIPSGNTSWTGTSDERLKDIIEPIENATVKVNSLRAVIGKFKTDEEGTRRSFLIAQDVQSVLPEAVSVRDDEIGTLGIAYTDVIPLLVAAIKEQQALITAQAETINALTARIVALEGR
jgi:hypothetical protein